MPQGRDMRHIWMTFHIARVYRFMSHMGNINTASGGCFEGLYWATARISRGYPKVRGTQVRRLANTETCLNLDGD